MLSLRQSDAAMRRLSRQRKDVITLQANAPSPGEMHQMVSRTDPAHPATRSRQGRAVVDPYGFSVRQVADRWGCSGRTVYSLIAEGQLGHLRIGSSIRVSPADLQEYEARQWHAPVSTAPASDSSCAVTATTSDGGRTAHGSAFQRGRLTAARLAGS